MPCLKGVHRSITSSFGGYNHFRNETTPEEKEIIRRVLLREIVRNEYWCVIFGSAGSEVCRRYAEFMGWHGKQWGEKYTLTEKERKERQRECNRRYREAHREKLALRERERREKERKEKENELAGLGNAGELLRSKDYL